MYCVAPVPLHDTGHVMLVPCGSCVSCYRNKKRAKAGRLLAELQFGGYPTAQCITLTLNQASVSLIKNSDQDFLKMVWRYRDKIKQRFKDRKQHGKIDVMVERGEEFGRLHAHCILMGCRYNVPNDKRFSHKDWKFGLIHAMDVTTGNVHYHAGHQSKQKVEPIWSSRNHLGHDLMYLLALSYVRRPPSGLMQPGWKLPVWDRKRQRKISKRFPWTPAMTKLFWKFVTRLGGTKPYDPILFRDMLAQHKELSNAPEFWAEMKSTELSELAREERFKMLHELRKARGRAL